MAARYLKDILNGLRYRASGDISPVRIKGAACDSRHVFKDGLFVAVKGHDCDGHDFINEAVSKGASAIVAEEDLDLPSGVVKILVDDARAAAPKIAANFYGHPSKKMKVIGVTGTNGKTTVTYLIESILKNSGKDAGVIGTINYRFKDKVMAAGNTTPGPFELQSILAQMLSEKMLYAVMEVSSHSLDQGRVDGILFDRVIFTNISSEHLDYHKTLERYFEAKTKIFAHLKKDGIAILNSDDKAVASYGKRLRCRTLTYGTGSSAEIRAGLAKLSLGGSNFTVFTPSGELEIETTLIGRHNMSNILAAVAFAFTKGIGSDIIRKGVKDLSFVPGRLEPIMEGQPFNVFVDFAHTQDALHNTLSLLKEISRGRIISVFGCGGNRDRTKRPMMGRTACRFSDRVIMTSDNPRFEEPGEIIRQIEAGVKGEYSNYETIEDRRSAIEKAIGAASAGDVVVIAGKGHEKYQIIKDSVVPFDDCEIVRTILKKRF